MHRLSLAWMVLLLPGFAAPAALAQGTFPEVELASAAPLRANIERLLEAFPALGASLPAPAAKELRALAANTDDAQVLARAQELLDPYCLAGIHINPESRVKASRGPARAELVQDGWSVFLIKVHNEAGVTQGLRVDSPHLLAADEPPRGERWLTAQVHQRPPSLPRLTGHELEYVILRLQARESGRREARLAFDVAQGNQDLGFRAETPILFLVRPMR